MRTKVRSLIFLFFLLTLLSSCTLTTTRSKPPTVTDAEGLKNELGGLVIAQNINLDGKEITTNGKTTSQLQISITNGQNIPQEDDLKKMLSRSVVKQVVAHLRNSNEYDFYNVSFVIKNGNEVLTHTSSISYDFSVAEVNAPYLNIGKHLTSENGNVFGGAGFTRKDSEIVCVLTDYRVVDTSAVTLRLYRRIGKGEENVTEDHVKVNAGDNYLLYRIKIPAFCDAYGEGKFAFAVMSHDTIIASKDFEVK